MAKVTGFGGLFFRAHDPSMLKSWYETHLGLTEFFLQEAGPTVFAPFASETEYFGRASQQFMVNLRVDNLDALIASLASAGIDVETRADWDTPETGRFARIYDPEGNPVELWQPATP